MDSTTLSPQSDVVPPLQVKLSSKGWNDLLGGSQLLAGRAVRAGEGSTFQERGPQNLKDVKKRWKFRWKLGVSYHSLANEKNRTWPGVHIAINILIRVLWCIRKKKSSVRNNRCQKWRARLFSFEPWLFHGPIIFKW